MSRNKLKRIKIIFIVLTMVLLIVNIVICIYTKGLNSQLLISSITFASVIIVSTVTGLKYDNKSNTRGLIIIPLFIAVLYVATIMYSPRYTYNQAKNLIRDTLSLDVECSFLNLKNKTINVDASYNPFISKGYLVGIRLESEDRFYLVNPFSGKIVKLDLSSEDLFAKYLMEIES